MNASSAATLMPPVIPPPPSPHDRWIAAFPLRSFLELGAYDTAPGSARGHARNMLAEWRLGEFEEKVTLIVSEIVTNSVAATRQARWEAGLPPVRLWLLAGPDGVLVAVWDAVPDVPEPREATELDESGRGLWIVGQLSAQWDCYLPPAPHAGKVTRALITTRDITVHEAGHPQAGAAGTAGSPLGPLTPGRAARARKLGR